MESYPIYYNAYYKSKNAFMLNFIKRYTNNYFPERYGEIHVSKACDYHLIFSSNEILYINTPDKKYELPENTLLVYKPIGRQEFIQTLNSSYVHCIFSGTSASKILKSLELDCNTVYSLTTSYMSVDEFFHFNKQLESIGAEFRQKEPYYKYKATGMFLDFLSDAARHIKLYSGTDAIEQIQSVIQYIMKKNASSPLDINELVEMSHLSRSRFYQIFKECTGTSPIGFQHALKLNISKDYISFYDKMPIKAIASTLGFSDPLYFSKLFRKQYGMSPSEYRKELRKSK